MFSELKNSVCEANRELVKHELVLLTWGNLSAVDRTNNVVAIKPSGIEYETLEPKHIVIVDLETGLTIDGANKPSTDTPTHLVLYRNFSEIKSIVHTHSTFATAFAQAKKTIRCLGTTHADYFFGEIPIIDPLEDQDITKEYELNTGKYIVNYFYQHQIDPIKMPGCLIPTHGPFIWAHSIKEAIHNSVVLEQLAKMNFYTILLNSAIEPESIGSTLLHKHFFRKHGSNAYYGQEK